LASASSDRLEPPCHSNENIRLKAEGFFSGAEADAAAQAGADGELGFAPGGGVGV